MRVQNQSAGIKKGSGKEHDKAVDNVIKFLEEHNNLQVYKEWYVRYNDDFVRREKIDWTPEHNYDIAVLFKDKPEQFFIEVDGESHGKPGIRGHETRKIKDGIAVKHANESGISVVRLDKTECLGDPDDRNIYLMQNLWRFIK